MSNIKVIRNSEGEITVSGLEVGEYELFFRGNENYLYIEKKGSYEAEKIPIENQHPDKTTDGNVGYGGISMEQTVENAKNYNAKFPDADLKYYEAKEGVNNYKEVPPIKREFNDIRLFLNQDFSMTVFDSDDKTVFFTGRDTKRLFEFLKEQYAKCDELIKKMEDKHKEQTKFIPSEDLLRELGFINYDGAFVKGKYWYVNNEFHKNYLVDYCNDSHTPIIFKDEKEFKNIVWNNYYNENLKCFGMVQDQIKTLTAMFEGYAYWDKSKALVWLKEYMNSIC